MGGIAHVPVLCYTDFDKIKAISPNGAEYALAPCPEMEKEGTLFMKICKRLLLGVLLAAVLLTALPVPAFAVDYADLPVDHWAYGDMAYAAQLGIIQGVGGNYMGPTQSLSWAQTLAMVTRAFAPDSYQAAIDNGFAWYEAGLKAARENGMVLENDFLPVSAETINNPITRQDIAVILYRALPENARKSYSKWAPTGEKTLTDWNSIPASYQEAVDVLTRLWVIRGKGGEGSNLFGGTDALIRSEGSALLMRTLSVVDNLHRRENKTVTLNFVGTDGTPIGTASGEAAVGDMFFTLADKFAPEGYALGDDSTTTFAVSTIQDTYTLTLRPKTEEELAYDRLERGEITWEEFELQDFWLRVQRENARKSMLLFGDTTTTRFPNYDTAKANMTSVTVPVWKLSNGKKVASSITLQMHWGIAEDVKAIFTEIFNDPEQFPIYSAGGFRYVSGTTGEHNCGTAIDINANENYQVRDGKAQTGKLWQPGVNPYSIPENGSVVRIFEAHGWSWGGYAWAGGSSDQTTGYHDYMHFSYMGK